VEWNSTMSLGCVWGKVRRCGAGRDGELDWGRGRSLRTGRGKVATARHGRHMQDDRWRVGLGVMRRTSRQVSHTGK
jgi:hypothetical protein